jgi:hypothetical protein
MPRKNYFQLFDLIMISGTFPGASKSFDLGGGIFVKKMTILRTGGCRETNLHGPQVFILENPRGRALPDGLRIQGQGQGNGIAEVSFFILDLKDEPAAGEGNPGACFRIQKNMPGKTPAPIFPDFDKTQPLADPGLLERAYDPFHVAIRGLGPEKNLPGIARAQFF